MVSKLNEELSDYIYIIQPILENRINYCHMRIRNIVAAIFYFSLLFLTSCVSEEKYNDVLDENEDLQEEIRDQKDIIVKLTKENKSLQSDLYVVKKQYEQCENRIYGDAFTMTLSGYKGYVRLEGYEEAVEYLYDCCRDCR